MIIRRDGKPFPNGLTPVIRSDADGAYIDMDFGILRLARADEFADAGEKERAFMLMTGSVRFTWIADGVHRSETVSRQQLLDEEPTALHVPRDVEIAITCLSEYAELAVQQVVNDRQFAPTLWLPGMYRSDRFGEGTMQDTSTRVVRTIFDAATAPESGMVLGEVINFPGKWSSYPPHDHAQPEVYHYRFFPEHGFGHAECEDEVFKVKNGDTYAIPPHVTHSQCAAPGYAMYYIWMIPHLADDRFGPDSRVFRSEHTWVMESEALIWPDAPVSQVGQVKSTNTQ